MNMQFFQSEENLEGWLTSNHALQGAVLSVPQLWKLSNLWYHNRMSPDYHGRTLEQIQQIFRESGLTSEFWQAT